MVAPTYPKKRNVSLGAEMAPGVGFLGGFPLNPRPLDGDGMTRLSPRIGGVLSRALGRSATPAVVFNVSV